MEETLPALFDLELDEHFEEIKGGEHDEENIPSSHLLYPLKKNDDFLNAPAHPSPFIWNNLNQSYSNIFLDFSTGQIQLSPVLPQHLLLNDTFIAFINEHQDNIFIVVRVGYEIHFGKANTYRDIEKKIIKWLNHHIYDTMAIVDIHDFYPRSKTRRVLSYCAMLSPKKNNKCQIYWKKGYLYNLQEL